MDANHTQLPAVTQTSVIGVDANGALYTSNQPSHPTNGEVAVYTTNNSTNHGGGGGGPMQTSMGMPQGGGVYNPVRRYSEPVNMITPIPIPRTNPTQWLGMSLEYLGINPGTHFLQVQDSSAAAAAAAEHTRRRALPERRLPPTPEESDLSVILAENNRKLVKASGASTVAIDNKIEQAMDLVKSHLMFAVREEVEVLKEQIKELLEKNNQLEYENSILKAAATPETMTKLQQSSQSQPPTSSS